MKSILEVALEKAMREENLERLGRAARWWDSVRFRTAAKLRTLADFLDQDAEVELPDEAGASFEVAPLPYSPTPEAFRAGIAPPAVIPDEARAMIVDPFERAEEPKVDARAMVDDPEDEHFFRDSAGYPVRIRR